MTTTWPYNTDRMASGALYDKRPVARSLLCLCALLLIISLFSLFCLSS